ncbi:biotin/lipoyl-containing protein [Aquisphaera insulae]|uniref:biotin/lipoyl-containing protein n=1 Tax=Aquisphaera insulae TaxID=2712864 RepID=UPI0013EBED2D|nr:biotin/lipoyl-containing protein [Aquisphaera insulae]
MKLKINVDGKLYEVDVEVSEPDQPQPGYYGPGIHARVPAAAPVAAPPLPQTGGEKVADESKVCRSPFAGTVSSISAQAGQSIQVNDTLLVLEAMKMETVITAPIAGKVAKINVSAGDAVQQGQVLVEFE